ncbi:hypothetical protein ACF0H5_015288 [Mactra antiquata]
MNKQLLSQCIDVVGEMYKLSFEPEDYCKKPGYLGRAPNPLLGQPAYSYTDIKVHEREPVPVVVEKYAPRPDINNDS